MKQANPISQDLEGPVLGLAWLLFALLISVAAWLVAIPGKRVAQFEDPRRVEFVRSAAGIQDGIDHLRQLERGIVSSRAIPERSDYYRHKRDAARQRIDALARSAATVAETADERTRLDQLAMLTRVADARYQQVLASVSTQTRGEIQ